MTWNRFHVRYHETRQEAGEYLQETYFKKEKK